MSTTHPAIERIFGRAATEGQPDLHPTTADKLRYSREQLAYCERRDWIYAAEMWRETIAALEALEEGGR